MAPVAMFFRSIGPTEIVVIVVALMLVFGATRLPKMGASLGQSLRAFKGALTDRDDADASNNTNTAVPSNTTEKEST